VSYSAHNSIVAELLPDAEVERVVRLTGGVSADVHRIDLRLVDGTKTSLVLRSHGASYSGHPADLEHQLLQVLHQNGLPVPKPLLFDTSGSLFEDPFLLVEFIEGTSEISSSQQGHCIDSMANMLAQIHALPIADLPTLPMRTNPLPEVFDYLPGGEEWQDLFAHLRSLSDTECVDLPKLLHGDYWPKNLLCQNDTINSVIDWEDAAIGDPVSDVACCRLALWQVYVAAAAQRFMGEWGLDPTLEAHMRSEALNSIREAGAILMRQTN